MSHLLTHSYAGGLLAVTEADLAAGVVPGWLKLTITIAVFVLPFVVGNLIARALRVKEWGQRIGVVLLAATLGVLPFAYQYLARYYEQAAYDRRVASWEERGEQFQISDEDVEELRKRRAGLTIITEASDRPQRTGAAVE
jgi:hypothetical protein